jgi:hypothetical protein
MSHVSSSFSFFVYPLLYRPPSLSCSFSLSVCRGSFINSLSALTLSLRTDEVSGQDSKSRQHNLHSQKSWIIPNLVWYVSTHESRNRPSLESQSYGFRNSLSCPDYVLPPSLPSTKLTPSWRLLFSFPRISFRRPWFPWESGGGEGGDGGQRRDLLTVLRRRW